MANYNPNRRPITRLSDLNPGDHIVINEGLYDHHMIVVEVLSRNSIRVIHKSKRGDGVVEEVVHYKPHQLTLLEYDSPYSPDKIIRRARDLIGQDYNVLSANCEHFATEVRTAEPQSRQVQLVGIILAIIIMGAAGAAMYYNEKKGKKSDSDRR